MAESIFWYDFETTGIDPVADRAIQFAGVRTDLDFNVIDEPVNLFSRPGDDIIPVPAAINVTGIRMSELIQQGVCEAAFCAQVLEQFARPQTCVAGYNSIRFDDEFTRQMFYRNFIEPYAREWQSGNSRWDVIDLFRMAYALRPDGMTWPLNEAGKPSFRLEHLTSANGINHDNAHDAVADVLATIALTARLKQKQPKLVEYLFGLRSKKQVLQQLYPLGKAALIHVSSMYPAESGCAAIVLPLCTHPTNPNGIVCFDLSFSPDGLIKASAEEVNRLVFTRIDALEEGEHRIPLKTVHINRCPALAPLATLDAENALRLGLEPDQAQMHLKQLQGSGGLVEKIQEAFASTRFDSSDDPDHMLYQGEFFSSSDVAVMTELRVSSPDNLAGFTGRFQDSRLDEMLFRYRARNWPESLNELELKQWKNFKLEKWRGGSALDELEAETRRMAMAAGEPAWLTDLESYIKNLRESLT